MKKLLDDLVFHFGFDSGEKYIQSMFHHHLLMFTVSVSLVSATIETLFGLKVITLTAFIIMLTFELFTGIVASRIRGNRISSRKFSRFGFKLFTWLVFLFILNVFKNQYAQSLILSELFNWLHSTIVIYVSLEYLISILENLDTITGADNSMLTKALRRRVKSVLGEESERES